MTHSRQSSEFAIDVPALARVEGEGGLRVEVRDGAVANVALRIFEPPRFFEGFLQGRRFEEVPDITARICGICPVAYQMSACAAIEDAFGVAVDERVQALRRLLYCGEWVQSHALHVYLLHAPDFFGCADAVELAQLDRAAVQRGLELKRVGNLLMEAVGGRSVHPVNVRVGGFYKAPRREDLRALLEPLRRALGASLATAEWVAGFDYPDVEGDYHFVALRPHGTYPIDSGPIASSHGLETTPAGFAELVVEEHVERSTALHARLGGRDTYLTGPLARYALNSAKLPELARQAATAARLGAVCTNPFQSIAVRAVELVFACNEAIRLIEQYEPPQPPASLVHPVAGTGAGATEAPRGLLLHRYVFDAGGLVRKARIVPPTSQNQLTIEDDLRQVVTHYVDAGLDELTARCEQAVRNHDPCISCAAHFLEVEVERS